MSPFTKLILLCLFTAILSTFYSVSIASRLDPIDGNQTFNVDGNDVVSSWFQHSFELNYGFILLLLPLATIVGLSLKLCIDHLKTYNTPIEQGPIIVIAALPSIFAVCSYIGLLLANPSVLTLTILDGITEGYSAFTMVMFYQLLYAYLENEDMDLMHGQLVLNLQPFTIFQPYKVPINRQTIQFFRVFVIQYFVVRLLGSSALTLLQVIEWVPANGVQCLTVVSFASCTIAMFVIVIFFNAVRGALKDHHLKGKLFCLKALIGFSFFQVNAIWYLQLKGLLDSSFSWFNIQNVLLLIEMVPYTFYMVYCYSCASYRKKALIVQTEAGRGSNAMHEC